MSTPKQYRIKVDLKYVQHNILSKDLVGILQNPCDIDSLSKFECFRIQHLLGWRLIVLAQVACCLSIYMVDYDPYYKIVTLSA